MEFYKYLLKTALKRGINFINKLWSIITDPKQFAISNINKPNAKFHAIMFLTISIVMSTILLLPTRIPSINYEGLVISCMRLIICGLTIAGLAAGVMFLIWKVVAAKLDFGTVLILSSYFSSISNFIWAATSLLAVGFVYCLDKENADAILNGYSNLIAMEGWGFKSYLITIIVGTAALIFWSYRVWGTYRYFANVSRVRSAFAFCSYLVFFPVLFYLSGVASAGVISPILPSQKIAQTFPKELIGTWKKIKLADDKSGPEITGYTFSERGGYSTFKATSNKHCGVAVYGVMGNIEVKEASLILTPLRNIKTLENCSRSELEKVSQYIPEVYQYSINKRDTGWGLCLAGKFGKECFLPDRQGDVKKG